MTSVVDLEGVIQNAETILPHRCNERCRIAVGLNEYRCRKLDFLLIDKPSLNTMSTIKELSNDLLMECL